MACSESEKLDFLHIASAANVMMGWSQALCWNSKPHDLVQSGPLLEFCGGRVVLCQTKAWYLPWHNTHCDVKQGRLENSFYHVDEFVKEAEAQSLDLI